MSEEMEVFQTNEIAEALGASQREIRRSRFGSGVRLVFGAGQRFSLDLYAEANTLRLRSQSTDITLRRVAPPVIGDERVVFETYEEQEAWLRHLSLSRRGEVTLIAVPLSLDDVPNYRQIRAGDMTDADYAAMLSTQERPVTVDDL